MALWLIGLPQSAVAQNANVVAFDVPAQPLETAIRQVASEQNLQILFAEEDVKGVTTHGIKGEYTAREAIQKLLEGTGLTFTFNDRNVVAIKPAGKAQSSGASTGGSSQNPILLAQAQAQERVGASDSKAETLEHIVVTGTRLGTTNQSIPLKTYTAERIEESGKTSIVQFLNTLTEVPVPASQDRFSSTGGHATVRLRGFPAGTTALLLNGRRLLASADFTDFDLNALPLGIIDRIDVLPTGSSAIYGSNAIAGVVNFITKRDMSGVSLSATVGQAADYTEQHYSAGWGKNFDRGSLSLVAAYDTNGQLAGRDREIVNNADYRRFADRGGTDRRVSTCDPGNVSSTTSANLPGLNSTVAAVPVGVTGRPSTGDFIATQGTTVVCSNFKDLPLIPSIERKSLFANARYDLTPSLEAFAELLYAHNRTSFIQSLVSFSRVVPASNAFNPFAVGVRVNTELKLDGGQEQIRGYVRPLTGLP